MRHAPLLLVTLFVTSVSAQDAQYVRALERAQDARPATIGTVARIAPPEEPGTPLVIHGRVLAHDARTPVPGAIVFAYHTDRDGLYDNPGSGPHSWRLRGWSRTDEDGRFEFLTVRPGPYPAGRVPAHVHLVVFANDARYHAGELRFEDDTFVTDRERRESRGEGRFGAIRPVRRDGQTEHVEFTIRLNPADRF